MTLEEFRNALQQLMLSTVGLPPDEVLATLQNQVAAQETKIEQQAQQQEQHPAQQPAKPQPAEPHSDPKPSHSTSHSHGRSPSHR